MSAIPSILASLASTLVVAPVKRRLSTFLYGVITHIGESGESGHFIASCKSPIENNKWYKYNDCFISPITNFNKEVVNFGTPYILFYQRKKIN